MKRRLHRTILLILLITVLACLNTFGNDKEKYGFYVPRKNEEIYGTWVNTAHTGLTYAQKYVIYDWGGYERYSKATDETFIIGAYIIVDRWTDLEGNIWYKTYVQERNDWIPIFELDKISKGGTVWEFLIAYDDFPKPDNMNSRNPYYRIYYREQDAF